VEWFGWSLTTLVWGGALLLNASGAGKHGWPQCGAWDWDRDGSDKQQSVEPGDLMSCVSLIHARVMCTRTVGGLDLAYLTQVVFDVTCSLSVKGGLFSGSQKTARRRVMCGFCSMEGGSRDSWQDRPSKALQPTCQIEVASKCSQIDTLDFTI
jgi:hypothetical protein